MLLDKRSTFARELSIPAAGGPTKFGEALPLGVASDLGVGEPIYLHIGIPTAAVGGTSLAFQMVTADDDALTSPTILWQSPTFVLADLVAGARLFAGAIGNGNYKKFVGLRATVVGTFSAGKVNAFFTFDAPSWRAYPNARV